MLTFVLACKGQKLAGSSAGHSDIHKQQNHSQSPNNGLLKNNGGEYPPRQSVFTSES